MNKKEMEEIIGKLNKHLDERYTDIIRIIDEKIEKLHDDIVRMTKTKETAKQEIIRLLEEEKHINYSLALQHNLIPSQWEYKQFHRLMHEILRENGLKTEMIGKERYYYTDSFDIDSIKAKKKYKQIRKTRDVMFELKNYCKSEGGRVNIGKFLDDNFSHIPTKKRYTLLKQFRGICRQNQNWGIVPDTAHDYVTSSPT